MKHSLTVLGLLSSFTLATAQISRPGVPPSAAAPLTEVPHVVLPAPDLEALRAEDAERGDLSFRYGAAIPTSIGLDESGVWDVGPAGELVWRLQLHSPGAFSLGIVFAEFDLPPGARVFLYSPDRSSVLGAFGEWNEKPNGMLAIQPLPGDTAVIEYVHPAGTGTAPRLRIGEVIHDYRDLFGQSLAATENVSCLIDVNCPQGDPWQTLKRSEMEILTGGAQCSATLINNTNKDETPYVLTANHCGDYTNGIFVGSPHAPS